MQNIIKEIDDLVTQVNESETADKCANMSDAFFNTAAFVRTLRRSIPDLSKVVEHQPALLGALDNDLEQLEARLASLANWANSVADELPEGEYL